MISKNKKKKQNTLFISILILVLIVFLLCALIIFVKKRDYSSEDLAVKTNGEESVNTLDHGYDVIIEDVTMDDGRVHPLFVGDSRTVGMKEVVQNINCIAQVGAKIDLIYENDSLIRNTNSDCVVIGLGINDYNNPSKYINYANSLGEELRIPVFFVTVNPVDEQKVKENGYKLSNKYVDEFNEKLFKNAQSYIVIDTNSYVNETGFFAYDGLHYDSDTYQRIYDYIMQEVDNWIG